MIKTYCRRATIKAEQFDGSAEMIAKYGVIDSEGAGLFLPTLEGNLEFYIGDWIATGVKGEHWAIADDVFKRTYAELPMIPQAVANWIVKCKRQYRSIASALVESDQPADVKDYFRNYQSTELWIKLQDDFARAWLDGYQVEGEK